MPNPLSDKPSMKQRIILLAIVISTSFTLTMTSCRRGDSPREVAETFLQYFGTNDYEHAKDFGTDETDRLMDMFIGLNKMSSPDSLPEEVKFEIISDKVEGDLATVKYRIAGTQDEPQDLHLVREDGKWLVSMSKSQFNTPLEESENVPGTSTAPAQ